jgi:hypothetical protein
MESEGIILRIEENEPLITKGSELTFEDLDGNFIKIYQDLFVLFNTNSQQAISATGSEIDFTTKKVYNTHLSPSNANITANLTNAKIGIVQKIYHLHTVPPTFPAGWVLVGQTLYLENSLNIITCEFVSGTRVEYSFKQEFSEL